MCLGGVFLILSLIFKQQSTSSPVIVALLDGFVLVLAMIFNPRAKRVALLRSRDSFRVVDYVTPPHRGFVFL